MIKHHINGIINIQKQVDEILKEVTEIYDLYSGLLDGIDPIGTSGEALDVIIEIGKKFDNLIGKGYKKLIGDL